ncbi:MAG: hypothetical protein R8K20_11235 [Gallionellaceae bacterium]
MDWRDERIKQLEDILAEYAAIKELADLDNVNARNECGCVQCKIEDRIYSATVAYDCEVTFNPKR